MNGSWSKGNGGTYGYYHCDKKDCSYYVRKEVLENKFKDRLKSFKLSEKYLNLLEQITLDFFQTKVRNDFNKKKNIEKQLALTKEKKEKLLDLFLLNQIDNDTYVKKNIEIDKEIKDNEDLIHQYYVGEDKLLNKISFFV